MSSPERASVRQRRLKLFDDYGLLVGSAVLLSFGMSSWGVLLPIYFRTVGLSVPRIGGLLSGVNFMGLFAALPLGFIADQLGRKRGLVVSLVFSIMMQLSLGIARNIWGIAFAVILSVFANQLHEVSENALLTFAK